MESLAEILEQTLEDAVEVKDKKSLHRYIVLLTENIVQKQNYEKSTAELRSDIRVLAEAMKEGFASVDKRFEDLYHYLDKRFEDMNKRFEDMNNRFGDMNKRFEDMNNRFGDMNKRFEDMNKRFNMMFTFMNIGFGIIIILTVLFKFIQ